MTINRVQGDTGDTVARYLYGVDTFVGATAVAHVWRDGVTSTTLTASIADAFDGDGVACGLCVVNLGSWITTATVAIWFLEYQVTFADLTPKTWPARRPDDLNIRAQGA